MRAPSAAAATTDSTVPSTGLATAGRTLDAAGMRTQGCTRRRAGKGFTYLDCDGSRLPAEEITRIKSLAIPPAWEEVWICPLPNGHIQAVGTDDAGRRQYLYHPSWREKQDARKFDRILTASRRLPDVRRQVTRDLRVVD